MKNWYGHILVVVLFLSSQAFADGQQDNKNLELQLMLLDKFSFHPSLLPMIMNNFDYLDLTPEQQSRLLTWRKKNAANMLEKMRELAQGRVEFLDASLNKDMTGEQLTALQRHLFALQEEVLAYKLSCRHNILQTFTQEQWDSLQMLYTEQQMAKVN